MYVCSVLQDVAFFWIQRQTFRVQVL